MYLYPRPETVKFGKKLIKKFDGIVGHHPHCPQPITIEKIGGTSKVLAYSLGDFSFGIKLKKYQYSTILNNK